MLSEGLIKIKVFEDIIDKWPEKVFINSSLNLDESDMLVEHYMLSGRNDSGNIQAILMFYAWLFVRANCELKKYIRQDYVATFFPRNDPKSGQEVVEEILKALFNPSNDYCILDEKTPPGIEGLHLASNRVLCALENIASWSRDRIDVSHGSICDDRGTIGFCVQQQEEEGSVSRIEMIRAIPLTFNTLILRAPGGLARVFTICCDCPPRSETCTNDQCSCKFYLDGEKSCFWMCERSQQTGRVFDRPSFETRLVNYKDENIVLGKDGNDDDILSYGGDSGDVGGDGQDNQGMGGSINHYADAIADSDQDEDSDDDEYEGNEENEERGVSMEGRVNLFNLNDVEMDDLFMEQELCSFLRGGEAAFVEDDKDSSDDEAKGKEEFDEEED